MSLFFTCKQVSRQLSREDYESLPPLGKLTLKFHVLICPVCGAYNRQVMKFQDLVRTFRARKEAELESPAAPTLDDERRARMKEALRQAREDQNPAA
jgi:hypothetical protein